jgi:ABC-2 type transport system ATP-binding protein/lipopolysaccharide transport system ATP-binding protein
VAGQEQPTKVHRYRRILDQVSLEIADGERVGILGPNGAGKTTLLRIIAGIFEPDEGTIERNSDVSALLDSGYGMVDSLTARENCISRLIVAGIPKSEIPAIIDWIEDLTEIGEYFDQPMRTFSSGMFARTIFALATARPHEVIVIDEGFGLADEYFRRKAQGVLEKLYNDASILIFASHNAELLKDTCQRGIVLKDGKIAFDGNIVDAIEFNHS